MAKDAKKLEDAPVETTEAKVTSVTAINAKEVEIRFNKELWNLYSDAVLAKHLALMGDWLNGIDTKIETKLTHILQPSSKSFIN